jgi:HAE1 family hydrophobic/amphiphilic exporter-1
VPGDQAFVNYTLALQQWQLRADAYGRYQQANAGVSQAKGQVKALGEQLDASLEQADKSAEQQEQSDAFSEETERLTDEQKDLADAQKKLGDKQTDLADEQKDIADVRAKPIRVRDIAAVTQRLAPSTVTQIDGIRVVTVTATPENTDNLGALTTTVQTQIDALKLPAGVAIETGGASEDQADAFRQLGLAMLLAIMIVFIIMVATFRSLVLPLILLSAIPFAATGAVAALLITGTPLGVPAMVGLLMLIGIVVTNAIVLIDLINRFRARGENVHTAVVDGARLRLRPIIMTATATICALTPMGLGLTGGGAFIGKPLAVVVIGGLVSSTILTLLLVPVLYTLSQRRGERKRQRQQQAEADAEAATDTAERPITPGPTPA